MKAKDEEKAYFLLKRGWRKASHSSPWIWFFKSFPHAHHTIDHAYDIERGKK